MVEQSLLKLTKTHNIGSEFENKWQVKNTACCQIGDMLVTLHHMINPESDNPKKDNAPQTTANLQHLEQTCLLKLIKFDVRESKEIDSREVCWPYSIKSIDIHAQNQTILILSQSPFTDKDGGDKCLLFEIDMALMETTDVIGLGSKSQNSKNSLQNEEEMTITEVIEQFLASDFEIKADPKQTQTSSRLGMFAPSSILRPFSGSFFGQQSEETKERQDPYPKLTELQLFKSSCKLHFVATLLHENFATVKYCTIFEQPKNSKGTIAKTDIVAVPIIVLSKCKSNQLYRLAFDLSSIVKWISIDFEITQLEKVNQNLLLIDEYAQIFVVLQQQYNARKLQMIEVEGIPSASLLQNLRVSDDNKILYNYFLPSRSTFIQIKENSVDRYDLSFLNKGSQILLDVQLFSFQLDILVCLTDDSTVHFISKAVLDEMVNNLRELGTSGSIMTDPLFNNKSMIFNTGTFCDPAESSLLQMPLQDDSNRPALGQTQTAPQADKACKYLFSHMHSNTSTKLIMSSNGHVFVLKPILQIKSLQITQIVRKKLGIDFSDQSEEIDGEILNDIQQTVSDTKKESEIKNEVMKLSHLLPNKTPAVAQFLQGMYEDISSDLLKLGDIYLSFQFYILSGRFSIQYILDTYFEKFVDEVHRQPIGISALLTAGILKVIESQTFQTDVNFLFVAYCFVRGMRLVSHELSFEEYVQLMHSKMFKLIRPGGVSLLTKRESMTPEIFIMQLDLLASCASDIGLQGKQCPLYQIVFNCLRFAASRRSLITAEEKLLRSVKRKLRKMDDEQKNSNDEESDDQNEPAPASYFPKNQNGTVYRSQIFVKLLKLFADMEPSINQVMYSIVTEKPWANLILPLQLMNSGDLVKLKHRYLKYKEVKNRQITDFFSVMEVFGFLNNREKSDIQQDSMLSESSECKEASIGVKFEEEAFVDDDWFLTLLSELIFTKLNLEKPAITLSQKSQQTKTQTEKSDPKMDSEQQYILQITEQWNELETHNSQQGDDRIELIDALIPLSTRKGLLMGKFGFMTQAQEIFRSIIAVSEDQVEIGLAKEMLS